MGKTKNKPAKRKARNQFSQYSLPEKVPFIAHITELRKRLFYIGASVGLSGAAAIAIQSQLTTVLLKPAGDQQFIYTTPGGGFDFVFKLCLYTGIGASIPVIVYQLIRYLQPLVKEQTKRFVAICSLWSSILALGGMAFGYFFGLPAAMHFLLKGFSSDRIEALISIQSYMSFVLVYLLGSALLFQLPLILLVINRFKPIKPKTLMKQQRWFILGAFIIGAIISPTPDIRNQLMLSGPIILMYQLSIILIWAINRRQRRPKKVVELLRKDAELQAERLANFKKAQGVWREVFSQTPVAPSSAKNTASAPPLNSTATPIKRPQQYVQEFKRRPYHPIPSQSPQTE
jgi:sec-independent protein translocase protein TatC